MDEENNREIGNACIEEAAKILGVSSDEAHASFSVWMNEIFPEMWESANHTHEGLTDEDYNDYTDQYVLAVRPSGGGGGSGDEWVGMLVGFERRFDMIRRKREMAIDLATADIGMAIKNGFTFSGKKVGIGRAHTFEGYWRCEHSTGMYVSKDKADTKPNWVVPINESISIAILKQDNTPQRASSWKSMWAFYGNAKDKFLSDGPKLVALEGSFEAALCDWDIFRPITLKGKFDAKGWQDSGPTFTVSNPQAVYGLDWIPDDHDDKVRQNIEVFFDPEQFLTGMAGQHGVNLKDLIEHHFDNRVESYVDKKGEQRYDGPLVCVVGGVMDINHEGRESQWDPTGRDYWLSISSQVLRRENPNARIGIQVNGTVHDKHHGLEVLKNNEWLPYAKGSRIWIVGRTDDYTNNKGESVVKIDAQGIYAVPHKSIPAKKASDNSNNLSNLDGFGIGGNE